MGLIETWAYLRHQARRWGHRVARAEHDETFLRSEQQAAPGAIRPFAYLVGCLILPLLAADEAGLAPGLSLAGFLSAGAASALILLGLISRRIRQTWLGPLFVLAATLAVTAIVLLEVEELPGAVFGYHLMAMAPVVTAAFARWSPRRHVWWLTATLASFAAIQAVPLILGRSVDITGKYMPSFFAGGAVSVGVLVILRLERRRSHVLQRRLAMVGDRALRAQSALSRANDLRAALLAAVSHDVRTPLQAVKTASSSLLERDVRWTEAQLGEFYATIDSQVDALTHLVDELLDMSRVQSGNLPVRVTRTSIEDVIENAMQVSTVAGRCLVMEVGASLPAVWADPGLLERVVANLISNAVEWSGADKPVQVSAGRAGDRIEVRVIDHGPGIPLDRRESVFEPFQRFDDRRAGHRGLGLGLAISRGFVEAMGGRVLIEDTPGGGATFVVSLSAAQGASGH